MKPATQRVFFAALFLVPSIALAVEGFPADSFRQSALAASAMLVGVCAFLQPPFPLRVRAQPAGASVPAPLGPPWLRWSLGLAGAGAAIAGLLAG